MNNINLLVPDKIIKSRRKTLAILIDREGNLIVKSPMYCTKKEIYDFIFKKANWIISKRQNKLTNKKTIQFIDGETLTLLDKTFTLKFYDKTRVKIVENTIFLPQLNYRESFLKFIKNLIKNYIFERVEYFSKLYNLKYKSIKINSAKSRWGSCGADNSLNFTFRLVFAPCEVVDYIILHELTHTLEKNHQSGFYLTLSKFCKNYKQSEKWLKDNAYILDLV